MIVSDRMNVQIVASVELISNCFSAQPAECTVMWVIKRSCRVSLSMSHQITHTDSGIVRTELQEVERMPLARL